jgi:hypothetical protein
MTPVRAASIGAMTCSNLSASTSVWLSPQVDRTTGSFQQAFLLRQSVLATRLHEARMTQRSLERDGIYTGLRSFEAPRYFVWVTATSSLPAVRWIMAM